MISYYRYLIRYTSMGCDIWDETHNVIHIICKMVAVWRCGVSIYIHIFILAVHLCGLCGMWDRVYHLTVEDNSCRAMTVRRIVMWELWARVYILWQPRLYFGWVMGSRSCIVMIEVVFWLGHGLDMSRVFLPMWVGITEGAPGCAEIVCIVWCITVIIYVSTMLFICLYTMI